MKRLVFWGLIMPALLRRIVPAWFLESPVKLAARHPWITIIAIGGAVAVGGLAVAASGVIPLKASSGHWSITEWLVQFSKRRSVATHSLLLHAPRLDDPALVLRGAGHYDFGCRPCHGAVAGERPRIPQHMLPVPPDLTMRVQLWRPEELFYIVKHGLKFTGMPAWPAQQRDDEVWAVVAFLLEMPALNRDEYRRLARSEGATTDTIAGLDAPPDVVLESCGRCHGIDGRGRGRGAFPKLAGQRVEYLDRALRAYAERRRHSGIMGSIAAGLTAAERQAVARYYAAQPHMAPEEEGVEPPARGAEIATRGLPGEMIPACVECHSHGSVPKNAAYPRLAGQYPEYLVQQLELLKARRRGGSEYVHLMHSFVGRLTNEQMNDVAQYFGALRH